MEDRRCNGIHSTIKRSKNINVQDLINTYLDRGKYELMKIMNENYKVEFHDSPPLFSTEHLLLPLKV